MGKFRINGIDEISASFEQLTRLTDSDKMSIIMPAAKLLLERQVQKIQSLFNQRSGDLANSLTIEERSGDDGPYAYIFPKGKHSGSAKESEDLAAAILEQMPRSHISSSMARLAYPQGIGWRVRTKSRLTRLPVSRRMLGTDCFQRKDFE